MMESFGELFTAHGIFTLLMLVLLQAVLGFDNLLYISIESKRVEASQQQKVRRLGIGMAIFLRIALLFVVKRMIDAFQDPFFSFGVAEVGSDATEAMASEGAAADVVAETAAHSGGWLSFAFNLESIVVLFGGAFILYTAIKEIYHMVSVQHLDEGDGKKKRSVGTAVFWIVIMNLIFSFDSILSAMALTDNMAIMSLAIIISGLLMIVLADNVAVFLERNRMYEILGLFILFIVGVMLVSEGGHKAHLVLFGNPVEAMQKSTFYFVIAVLVIVDVVQSRYQKKLLAANAAH